MNFKTQETTADISIVLSEDLCKYCLNVDECDDECTIISDLELTIEEFLIKRGVK